MSKVLENIFIVQKKIYVDIPGDDVIGSYPKFKPIFLECEIKIFDKAFNKVGNIYEK